MAQARTSSDVSGTARRGFLTARPGPRTGAAAGEPGLRPLGLGGQRDGLVCVPRSYDPAEPAPLLVTLHGAGGQASQMIDDVLLDTAEAHGSIILSPESRGRTWDVILGAYGPDVAFIDEALGTLLSAHAIDGERIAISGFSDGASYALSIGLINGALFSDVLAFSPGFAAPTEAHDMPRIFISHGVHDQVLPIDPCSRKLVPRLRHTRLRRGLSGVRRRSCRSTRHAACRLRPLPGVRRRGALAVLPARLM
jgi:phospholipase/carboxylesterase